MGAGVVQPPAVAEQFASLDIRDNVSIAELRSDLSRILNDFCQANLREVLQSAFEPFYFSETIEEIVPLGSEARTLDEFREGICALSHASLQFHFITSRLPLQLRTNDLSFWLVKELGQKELARRIDFHRVHQHARRRARQNPATDWSGTPPMTQTITEKRVNKLDDYSVVLGAGEIAELRALASRLQGRTVQMSTRPRWAGA